MANFHITHITKYTYPSSVVDSINQVILFPIADMNQQPRSHIFTITSNPLVETFTDYFGNTVGMFTIIQPHTELRIQSEFEVTTQPVLIVENNLSVAEQWQVLSEIQLQLPYFEFLKPENFNARQEVKACVDSIINQSFSVLENVKQFAAFIFHTFNYKQGITSVETVIDEVWRIQAGVCQDFAHLLLVMLRMVNIPARYVSGYICPKNHELRGEGATHAWVEVYIPQTGWLGIDPTNNCIVSDRHVRLAIGRNFSDCTPVKGTYKGSSEHMLEVSVQITNGEKKDNDTTGVPSFFYTSQKPAESINSYRQYMEMQQQQ